MHETILIVVSILLAYMILIRVQTVITIYMIVGTFLLGLINGIWIETVVHEYLTSITTTIFSSILLFGAIYDSQYYILPDEGAILLSIIGTVQLFISGRDIALGISIAVVVYLLGILLILCSHGGFGLGDVKWLTALSLWLTPWGTYGMIFLSFNLGCLYFIINWLRNRQKIRIMPFGPFISIGSWISFMYGEYLWELF